MRKILAGAGAAMMIAALPALADPAERHIVDEHYIGCHDQALLKKADRIARRGDVDAAFRMLQPALASGDCVGFTNGDAVYVLDTAAAASLVKIRPRGGDDDYWIHAAAVSAPGVSLE